MHGHPQQARLRAGVINVCAQITIITIQIVILCITALSHLMQNKFEDTALIAASSQGHIECATVLLKHSADINYQNKVRLLYAGFSIVRMWRT